MKKISEFKKSFRKKNKDAITSSVADAKARYGQDFAVTASCKHMEKYIFFHITSEFSSLDKGYKRNCGPTAMVNLLLSCAAFYRRNKKVEPDPVSIFRRAAAYGKKRFLYFNTDFMGHFGGTLNLAVPSYIKGLLKAYRFNQTEPGWSKPAWPLFLKKELDLGAILFATLMFHPRYGCHDVLIYGYEVLTSADGKKEKLYLCTADGWSTEPRYLNAEDLHLSGIVPVYFKKASTN